jgi:hypothetical protein
MFVTVVGLSGDDERDCSVRSLEATKEKHTWRDALPVWIRDERNSSPSHQLNQDASSKPAQDVVVSE